MSEAKAIKEFTGKHMLIIVLLFFGTIISVNIFMATMAIQSWTGLVVKNSYVASQEFNGKLQASQVQAGLNLKIDLTYEEGILKFLLVDENEVPIALRDVKIDLTRPIGVTLDRSLVLAPAEVGYQIDEDLPAGVWNVVIHAQVPDQPDFNYRARLIVSPPAILGT